MQPGENIEDMKLQELSKRLEAIEKDNEQIKRENQLFQSYLLRKTKDEKKLEEEVDDGKGKKKGGNKKSGSDKIVKLPGEYKYYIANKELDTLK